MATYSNVNSLFLFLIGRDHKGEPAKKTQLARSAKRFNKNTILFEHPSYSPDLVSIRPLPLPEDQVGQRNPFFAGRRREGKNGRVARQPLQNAK